MSFLNGENEGVFWKAVKSKKSRYKRRGMEKGWKKGRICDFKFFSNAVWTPGVLDKWKFFGHENEPMHIPSTS